MTLVRHILRTDLREFRWLLAAWLGVLAAESIVRGLAPAWGAEPHAVGPIALSLQLLQLLRWLGLLVIVPLVVQAHTLVGSDQWWLTRPIPRGALLAAKLVLLTAALVVAPAVGELVLMMVLRVEPAAALRVFIRTILFELPWLLAAMVLAATTRTLARFALGVGAAAAIVFLLLGAFIAVLFRQLPSGPQLTDVAPRASAALAPMLMLLGLLLAALLLPVVVQYLRRQPRLAIAIAVGGVAAVAATALVWSPPGRPLPTPAWVNGDDALRLAVADPSADATLSFGGVTWHDRTWHTARLPVEVSGLEAGWAATLRLVDATADFGAGELRTARNGDSSQFSLGPFGMTGSAAVQRQLLGVDDLRPDRADEHQHRQIGVITLSGDEVTRYAGRRGTYRGRFLVDLDRLEIAAVLPLAAGGGFRGRGQRLLIDRVETGNGGVTAHVRRYSTSTLFDTRPPGRQVFYLRNRSHSEAVYGETRDDLYPGAGFALPFIFFGGFHAEGMPGGFAAAGLMVGFPPNQARAAGAQLTGAWLADAELVVVEVTTAGSVERPLVLDDFRLSFAPRDDR